MGRQRAIQLCLFCGVLAIGFAARASFFFSRASQLPPTSAPAQAQATQYLTLYSRVSVFALYCDPQNARGLNTHASQLGRRTRPSLQRAESAFGGQQPTESRFERMRNDESARLAAVADIDALCYSEDSAFWRLTPLSDDAFNAQAARVPLR